MIVPITCNSTSSAGTVSTKEIIAEINLYSKGAVEAAQEFREEYQRKCDLLYIAAKEKNPPEQWPVIKKDIEEMFRSDKKKVIQVEVEAAKLKKKK